MSHKINQNNAQLPENVRRYLERKAIRFYSPELNRGNLYELIVVVPAIEEFENSGKLLNSLKNNRETPKTLVLFVVNNGENARENVISDNLKLMEMLREESKKIDLFDLNFIDASSKGKALPEKFAGVGMARKIGLDTALTLFDYSSPNKKILACLDADCMVENNYFHEIVRNYNERNFTAAFIEFEHQIPNDETQFAAIVNYEIFLRYYVLGLKYANSPYAFHTIGSTITVDFENYVKIGGMNRKKAGEDFYFMEKLAKVTQIGRISSTTVYPSARKSWRVPFGTGQRINRFLTEQRNEYLLYNPESFEILKKWLEILNSNDVLQADDYLKKAEKIDGRLYNFLNFNNFKRDWSKILKNSGSVKQINLQKKLWFDGFRTLKLIHFLRDSGLPEVNMFDACDVLFKKIDPEIKIERNAKIPPVKTQLKYLGMLKKLFELY